MNNVTLIGNLTKDPEIKNTENTTICRFSIAVNDGFGDKQRTSFIPIVVFGKTAEACGQYLKKGSKVAIKGRIQTGSYEKDGRTVYTTDVIADNYGGVEFLGSKSKGAEEPEQTGFTALQDEEIPF